MGVPGAKIAEPHYPASRSGAAPQSNYILITVASGAEKLGAEGTFVARRYSSCAKCRPGENAVSTF
jgi:hypothetical protein